MAKHSYEKKPAAKKADTAVKRAKDLANPKGMLQDFLSVYGIGKKRKPIQ